MPETIRWEAEVNETCHAIGDDWQGEDVNWLPGVDVSEIAAADEEAGTKPMFAEMTFMVEGRGTGKPLPKNYLGAAVEDCARLALGVQAYLGHQDPKLRGREYRIPQGRVIASRVEKIKCPKTGKTKKVARAKLHVSKASEPLRTHLSEGMAGPVSIDGRAVLRTVGDEVEVPKMLSLRGIDFCNPGTEGVKGAGVDRIVSEMDDSDTHDDQETTMSTRLTREGLRTEYAADIREMEREAAEAATKPLEAQVQEMKAEADTAKATIAERDATIETLTGEKAELEARVTEMSAALAEQKTKTDQAALATYRDELVSEMGVIASAAKRISAAIPLTVVEDDDAELSKSRTALKTAAETARADVAEMAKELGSTIEKSKGKKGKAGDVSEMGTVTSNGDLERGSDKRREVRDALFPNMAKPKAKEGAAS